MDDLYFSNFILSFKFSRNPLHISSFFADSLAYFPIVFMIVYTLLFSTSLEVIVKLQYGFTFDFLSICKEACLEITVEFSW